MKVKCFEMFINNFYYKFFYPKINKSDLTIFFYFFKKCLYLRSFLQITRKREGLRKKLLMALFFCIKFRFFWYIVFSDKLIRNLDMPIFVIL